MKPNPRLIPFINEPYSPKLIEAIRHVWVTIAPDITIGDNIEAIEACLDANRLELAGYSDAARYLDSLVKRNGFGLTLYALALHPELQFM